MSTVRNRELVLVEQCVTLPRKDGVIAEAAQNGVVQRQEKHLKYKQQTCLFKNEHHPPAEHYLTAGSLLKGDIYKIHFSC